MTIRLYANPMSQHAKRAMAVVAELGLDVELKIVDFAKGEHKSPEYLSHNPNGKVPLLEHDGFWLWESNAILGYLADQKPERGLLPTDAKGRADVSRWLFWESAHFGPACGILSWERAMKPMLMKQPPDERAVADGEERWKRVAPVLEAQLAGREYVTGKLSIADFSLASALAYRGPAKIDLGPYPNVRAWVERIEARDAWKKASG